MISLSLSIYIYPHKHTHHAPHATPSGPAVHAYDNISYWRATKISEGVPRSFLTTRIIDPCLNIRLGRVAGLRRNHIHI